MQINVSEWFDSLISEPIQAQKFYIKICRTSRNVTTIIILWLVVLNSFYTENMQNNTIQVHIGQIALDIQKYLVFHAKMCTFWYFCTYKFGSVVMLCHILIQYTTVLKVGWLRPRECLSETKTADLVEVQVGDRHPSGLRPTNLNRQWYDGNTHRRRSICPVCWREGWRRHFYVSSVQLSPTLHPRQLSVHLTAHPGLYPSAINQQNYTSIIYTIQLAK